MNALHVFLIFLKLGLTSFGGPIAHLSYFHREFVLRRKWLSDESYADLVALCQILPGPASSQVGISLGLSRAGFLGALAAWLGFTLPSAVILVLIGLTASHIATPLGDAVVHGLKIAAVAIVAQAIWSMGTRLCFDRARISLAVVATVIASSMPAELGQIAAIFFGACAGFFALQDRRDWPHEAKLLGSRQRSGSLFFVIFVLLLLTLPFIAALTKNHVVELFSSFYQSGALVFGGGHVVLPLLQSAVVSSGWVDATSFMAGYGAAQAIPGPLFSFAAYLGAISTVAPNGWLGAAIALCAIYLPSFLLILGVLPYWERLRRIAAVRSVMSGINAAVVGILLAAFYQLVWTSAIFNTSDFNLAALAFVTLVFWKAPSFSIVAMCVLGRAAIAILCA